MNKKVNKKQKIRIAVLIGVAIYIFLVIHYSQQVTTAMQYYSRLDPDLRHVITTTSISGVAGLMFSFRTVEKLKKLATKFDLEKFETLELFILIIMPALDGFSYLIKTPSYFPWAILLFFSATIGWYILAIYRHKIFKEALEERQFLAFHTTLLIGFVSIGVVAAWALITWESLPKT